MIWKKMKSVLYLLFLALILFVLFNIKLIFNATYSAYILKDGKLSNTNLHLNIVYDKNLFIADNINGEIYSDDVEVLKYWKDYLRETNIEKYMGWNVKPLVYNPKNSFVDGKYINSGFKQTYPITIANIYYKNFMKSVVIVIRDNNFERKNGINYFKHGDSKPIIIVSGKVTNDDLRELSGKDNILKEIINDIPEINIDEKIRISNFKLFDLSINKSLENEYKEFNWKAVGSFVRKKDIVKSFETPLDKNIKIKIAEIENFKSGFTEVLNDSENRAYIENNYILCEGIWKSNNEAFYSIILLVQNNDTDGYVVDNVYTFIYEDNGYKFISEEFGILGYN